MKYLISHIILLNILLFIGGCTDNHNIKLSGHTMGTQYHIIMVAEDRKNSLDGPEIKNNIEQILAKINKSMSTYQADSEISQFNAYSKTDWFPISKDFSDVVITAQNISKLTQGAFDITVSPLVELWGFAGKIVYTIPDKSQINELLQYTGYELLEVRRNPPALRKKKAPLRIDLSAIAKGFAVDQISDYLIKNGFNNHLVEIGGEVISRGKTASGRKWRVAIESPEIKKNKISSMILLSDKALATSGDYRNYYIKNGKRYSHTLNPKTGTPVDHHLASVTVLDDKTMYADAYATALMVMGEVNGKAFALKHHLRVNMIIRNKQQFTSWNNLPNNIFVN